MYYICISKIHSRIRLILYLYFLTLIKSIIIYEGSRHSCFVDIIRSNQSYINGPLKSNQLWLTSDKISTQTRKTWFPFSYLRRLFSFSFCHSLGAVFSHGLKRPRLLGDTGCHPWHFIEEAAAKEVERDFSSVYSRLVLCKTFRLDEEGKVLSPEEVLYRVSCHACIYTLLIFFL